MASQFFLHYWLITGFVIIVTRMVPLVEQELLTLPEHPRAPLVFSEVRVARSIIFCVMFCRSLYVFLFFFLLAIVLSVLWLTDSDYPYIPGIFMHFLWEILLLHQLHIVSSVCPSVVTIVVNIQMFWPILWKWSRHFIQLVYLNLNLYLASITF